MQLYSTQVCTRAWINLLQDFTQETSASFSYMFPDRVSWV